MLINLHRFNHWRKWRYVRKDNQAKVLVLPVLPRLFPPPQLNRDIIVHIPDDVEKATLLYQQANLVPSLGLRLELSFKALEILVGTEEANRQVFEIVDEYLKQAAA